MALYSPKWQNEIVDGKPYKVKAKHLLENFAAIVSDFADRLSIVATAAQIVKGPVTYEQTQTFQNGISVTGTSTFSGSVTFSNPVVGFVQTGMFMGCFSASPPTGWVLMNGGTIGSASSAATNRANADCQSLFNYLWTNVIDTWAPVSGGRGVSAAADWAANKTIAVPDPRGRTIIGVDGTANRVTSASFNGVNADAIGGTGGAETHVLTIAQLPAHGHEFGAFNHAREVLLGGSGAFAPATGPVSNSGGTTATGSDAAHNNMPPWLAAHYIIKL